MLQDTARKMVEEIDAIMADTFKQGAMDLSMYDSEELMLIVRAIKVLDLSTKLVVEQAEMLADMNEKLNTIEYYVRGIKGR